MKTETEIEGMLPKGKECLGSLEAGRGKGAVSLRTFREVAYNILISDFQRLEVLENEFLLFEAKFVVTCSSSHRKQTHSLAE